MGNEPLWAEGQHTEWVLKTQQFCGELGHTLCSELQEKTVAASVFISAQHTTEFTYTVSEYSVIILLLLSKHVAEP